VIAVTPEAQAYLGKLNFMGTTIRDASTLFSEDLPRYQQQEAQWVAQMQRGEFTRNPQGPGCDWCPWFYVCGD